MRILILALTVLILGCAAKAPTTIYMPPPEREYNIATDVIWEAVLETFTDLEIPIDNIETASGFIRSDYILMDDKTYIDCGSVWKGVGYGGWEGPANAGLRITVFIREKDPTTTTFRFREAARGGTQKGEDIACVPTGKFGELFLQQFDERIASSNS